MILARNFESEILSKMNPIQGDAREQKQLGLKMTGYQKSLRLKRKGSTMLIAHGGCSLWTFFKWGKYLWKFWVCSFKLLSYCFKEIIGYEK